MLMYADDADVFNCGFKDFLQGPNKRVTKKTQTSTGSVVKVNISKYGPIA